MDPLQRHLQVDYPEGTEFDSSDTSVYFVKSGQVHLKAADKQLQDREVTQTVAQAAVAAQTMAATGPLSKVLPSSPPPHPLPYPSGPSLHIGLGLSQIMPEVVLCWFKGANTHMPVLLPLLRVCLCVCPGLS